METGCARGLLANEIEHPREQDLCLHDGVIVEEYADDRDTAVPDSGVNGDVVRAVWTGAHWNVLSAYPLMQ